jgi:hypothetical protein
LDKPSHAVFLISPKANCRLVSSSFASPARRNRMQIDEGGYKLVTRKVKSCCQGSAAASGGEPSSPQTRGEVRSIYKGQGLFSWEIEVL